MEKQKYFGIIDYVIFAATLLLSSFIGIFLACKQQKMGSSSEYLLASKSIPWFPIFISMVASFFSATGVMGIPAQIYTSGITFSLQVLAFLLPIILCAEVFTPIFRRLDLVSVNEYLERRYSSGVRIWGCILFHFHYLIFLSVALYAPSLALQSVADVPVYVTIISTGLVCTFYTSLGGMKAVVWTDVFQATVMMAGLLTIAIVGMKEVGSLQSLLDIADSGERLKLDFDPDPRAYHTVWGCVIGITFSVMVTWTVSQPTAQRALAAKTLRDARIALYSSFLGIVVVYILLVIDALVIYALYKDCDLLMSGRVSQNDQVLPYFVVNKLGYLKGMPGLLIACLFSFALSTLSSGLNAISAIFLEDIVVKISPGMSDETKTRISKLAAVVCGLFITGFAFVVPFLGKFVLKIVFQLFGIIGGPYYTLFALGIFTKAANKFGAYSGSITGIIVGLFLSIGQIIYPPARNLPPISVKGCDGFNSTVRRGIIYSKDATYTSLLAHVLSISYVWFGFIAISLSFLVGYVVSLCTRNCDKTIKIDSKLLYSYRNNWLITKCYKKKKAMNIRCTTKDVTTFQFRWNTSVKSMIEDNYELN